MIDDESACAATAHGKQWCRSKCIAPKECTAKPTDEIFARAKRLSSDEERRQLANDLRLEAAHRELKFEERDERLRQAAGIEALCTTPDTTVPLGDYVPRGRTSDEMWRVYGSELVFGIHEIHNQYIEPLFATSNQELPDKQRDRALEILTAAFEEFLGQAPFVEEQGAKKPSKLAKDFIFQIRDWIGDWQPLRMYESAHWWCGHLAKISHSDSDLLHVSLAPSSTFPLLDLDIAVEIAETRSAVADHLLIVINDVTPIARGVNPEIVKDDADNGHIGNRGHDGGSAPDYSARGGDRVHIRRRTAFDRKASFGKGLDHTRASQKKRAEAWEKLTRPTYEDKGPLPDISLSKPVPEELRDLEREKLKRELEWQEQLARWASPEYQGIVGLGPANAKPKRPVKCVLMKYERDVAAAKLQRALEEREREAFDDKIRAAKGHGRFNSARRSSADWKTMSHGDDDELPAEKAAVASGESEEALEREAEARAKAEYTARKDHQKLAVTEEDRKRQDTEKAAAEEEAKANESSPKPPDQEIEDDLEVEDDDEDN